MSAAPRGLRRRARRTPRARRTGDAGGPGLWRGRCSACSAGSCARARAYLARFSSIWIPFEQVTILVFAVVHRLVAVLLLPPPASSPSAERAPARVRCHAPAHLPVVWGVRSNPPVCDGPVHGHRRQTAEERGRVGRGAIFGSHSMTPLPPNHRRAARRAIAGVSDRRVALTQAARRADWFSSPRFVGYIGLPGPRTGRACCHWALGTVLAAVAPRAQPVLERDVRPRNGRRGRGRAERTPDALEALAFGGTITALGLADLAAFAAWRRPWSHAGDVALYPRRLHALKLR